MSAEDFFNAARALKRELTGEAAIGLDQSEVDAFNAIINAWKPKSKNPTALSDASAFFKSVRESFGALTQQQVDGLQTLLQAFGVASWPLSHSAYGLATGWHETNETLQPVREAYWVKDAEAWRKKNLKYYPWYGRGYVQLTWEKNYKRADEELDLKGSLIANPDLAMRQDIAAIIMVKGMEFGWFSGKKLKDYLPSSGQADIHQFANARNIINGNDKDVEIAEKALKFQDALLAGRWA